jgi:lysozyme
MTMPHPPSRRHVLAGLCAASLAACAPLRPVRRPATTGPVSDPALVGLDAVIDISHLNRVGDLAAARTWSGILGVIHKATEGVGWVDSAYAERRAAASAAGMLWGAYHFGTREYSGAEQAAAFLATAQPGPDTLAVLDLELNELNPANSMDLGRAEEFVALVQRVTGRLPLLYVHPAWADGESMGGRGRSLDGMITPGSILAACELWLADYRAQPELPTAWTGRGWRMWQYAGDTPGRGGGPFRGWAGSVAGIDRCDRSVFAGTAEQLVRFWTGAPA